MCATYVLSDDDNAEIRAIIHAVERRSGEDVTTGDIFPNKKAPVLLKNGPELLTWGFPHYKGNRVIYNARSETAMDKKMFKDSLSTRRCVIPASAFYEWSAEKKRFRFWLPGMETLYLGGFYNDFQGIRRYMILTTAANDSISPVHHRMPLMLRKSDLGTWFDDISEVTRIIADVQSMLESGIA